MEYEFSWVSFFIGIVILFGGAALTIWYRQVADTFGGGVGSYERYRAYGLVACAVGFIVMINLHAMLLKAFFGLLFSGGVG